MIVKDNDRNRCQNAVDKNIDMAIYDKQCIDDEQLLTDIRTLAVIYGFAIVSTAYSQHSNLLSFQDNALEIFLTNGRTFLLAFETTEVGKSF